VDLGEKFVMTEVTSDEAIKEGSETDQLADVEYEGFYEPFRFYLQNTINTVDSENPPSQ
jgi:hypothetical protein